MVGTTFVRLSKMIEDMSETVTPIPDFGGMRDLSTQWRKKVKVLKKFCDKMFGADRRHLVVRALQGKWTWEMLDSSRSNSPIHDLINVAETPTPIPEFNTIQDLSTQWRKKVKAVRKFNNAMFGADRKHLVERALHGKWTWEMLDPSKPNSPIHDLINEAVTPIPEFEAIQDLSTQWRKKVRVLKKFSDAVFGADRKHLVVRALLGKWTWEMLDPSRQNSPMHDLMNEVVTPIPEFEAIKDLSTQWRRKVKVLQKFSDAVFGADRKHLVVRALNGKWTWEKMDTLNLKSPIHDLKCTAKRKQLVKIQASSGILKSKIRIIKKLCTLSGGGDTKLFILERILVPSWNVASEFVKLLPNLTLSSSNHAIATKLILNISKKFAESDDSSRKFLTGVLKLEYKQSKNEAESHKQALISLAKFVNDLQKPPDGKKFATQKRMDRVKQIMANIKPHMSKKELGNLGFNFSWRTQKRALELHSEEKTVIDTPVSAIRGTKPLSKKFRRLIKETFTDSENVSQGMRRPVKKALDVDGIPKNALEMNRSMTRIINTLDYVRSKQERKAGKEGISESTIRKYAKIEVPELKKHRKRTGKCSSCHEYAYRCA